MDSMVLIPYLGVCIIILVAGANWISSQSHLDDGIAFGVFFVVYLALFFGIPKYTPLTIELNWHQKKLERDAKEAKSPRSED
jgi:hypothetical protein